MHVSVAQYDIWMIDLDPKKGHTQAGTRPCVVIQSDLFNRYSPLVVVLPLTSVVKKPFPSEILIEPSVTNGLHTVSRILGSQIITVDKTYLVKKIGTMDALYISAIQQAIKLVLGL